MSAEDVGRRLLGEEQKQRLDEVLRKLRNINRAQAPASFFNIPSLDRLLPQRQPDNGLDQPEQSRSDTLIEIVAGNASSGKTTLLYLITTLAVLPDSLNGVGLSGKDCAVVVIDADGRFDVSRLSNVMRSHIKHCYSRAMNDQVSQDDSDLDSSQEPKSETTRSPPSDVEIESLIHTSLRHIHIFRPQSFSSLMATLESLPSYLLRPDSTHHSRNRSLHSIMLDSTSAFYWQFRAQDEIQRVLALDNNRSNAESTRFPNYSNLVRQLKSLSTRFECPVITTSWKLSSSSHRDGPYLNPTLPTLPALRLEVRRVFTRPFGPRMSVEQAESLRKMRAEVVAEHKFRVEAGKAGFGFVISEHGVLIDDDT